MAQAADDFDYSALHSEEVKPSNILKPKEEKTSGIAKRKNIAQKASESPAGVDIPKLVEIASALNEQAPALQVPEQVTDWQKMLGTGAGALGAIGALYTFLQNKNIKTKLEELAAKDAKPDMREEVFKKPVQAQEPVIDPVKQAQQRFAEAQAAGIGSKQPQTFQQYPNQNIGAPVANVPGVAPNVPTSPVPPNIAPQAPATPVANHPAVAVHESPEYKALVEKFGPPTAITGSGMPAWEGKGSQTFEEIMAGRQRIPKGFSNFETLEKVPAKMAVVPGGQHFDEFANMIGDRAAAQSIVNQLGRYPARDEMKSLAKTYMAENNIASRAENLAKGLSKQEAKAVVPGIFKSVASGGSKTANLGKSLGVAAGLLAFSDLVKAAELGKKGEYKEAAQTAIPAVDPTGLATAAVLPEQTAQQLTTVSPIIGMLSQIIGQKIKAVKGAAVPR